MAVDDILGGTEEVDEPTNESIMEAMKANIEAKEQMIKSLLNQITNLERQLEDLTNL